MSDHMHAPATRQNVLVGTTRTKLVGGNPARRSMIISPPAAGRLHLFPDEGLTASEGLTINWDDDPLRLCCCDVGRLIASPWNGIIEAGDGPVTDHWNENSSIDNALLSLDHALTLNRRHRLTLVMASYTTAVAIKSLAIQVAAITVSEYLFSARTQVFVTHPFEGGAGEAIGADLAASGVALTLGHLALHGYTIDAGDGGANVGIIASTIDPHGRYS